MAERWSFYNDELFDLVAKNRKHGTCCLYERDDSMSKPGEINVIYNSKNQELVVKITGVRKSRFCDVDASWAKAEGEGDLSLEYWRRVHLEFFTKGNPNFKPTDMLELNEFELI